MRLRRFHVSYRVLRDLEIEFRQSDADPSRSPHALDLLVGPNGSGKSTVLQAIAEVVRRLERGDAVIPFSFELEYDLQTGPDQASRVLVSNHYRPEEDLGEAGAVWVKLDDGRPLPYDQLASLQEDFDPLPNVVVAFTTGSEEEWLSVGTTSNNSPTNTSELDSLSADERALRELPGLRFSSDEDLTSPNNRFLLVRAMQLPLVTMCGLLQMEKEEREGTSALRSVLEHAGIKRMCGFSLRFRLSEGIAKASEREEVEENLKPFASRALRLGTDRLLVFDLTDDDRNVAEGILEKYSSGFELFRILLSMIRGSATSENVLQQVNIFVERDGGLPDDQGQKPPLHLVSWLSDGERSFLGRMSLFTLLRQRQALVLLDEPEVHFNDYWKRHIVYLLDGALQGQPSHLLMTTHSSITLSDVPNDDIIVLERQGALTGSADPPTIPTLAADPSDIMVHVFGAPYASGEKAVRHIQRLLTEGDTATADSAREERLRKMLNEVAPGYWRYRVRRALEGQPS
jgi:predicted ATPase